MQIPSSYTKSKVGSQVLIGARQNKGAIVGLALGRRQIAAKIVEIPTVCCHLYNVEILSKIFEWSGKWILHLIFLLQC